MICDIVQIFSGFILQIILYICLFRIIWITLRHFYCEVQSRRKATKRLGQTELLADPNDNIPQLFDDSGNAEDVIFNEDALNQDDDELDDDEGAWEEEEEDFQDVQPLNQTYDKNDSRGGRGRLNQTFDANDSRGGGRRLNQTFNADDSHGGGGRLNQTFNPDESQGGRGRLNQTFDANDSKGGGGRLNQTFDANDSRGGDRRLNQTFDADDSKKDGGLNRNIGKEDEKILDELADEDDSSDVEADARQPDNNKADEETVPFPPKKTWRVYQNYKEILKECLEKKILFEDPEFPANTDSLAYSKEKFKETKILKDLKWSRPPEITKEPKFFMEGSPTRFNMIGGQYGENMGLLSGVACMTLYPELIFKVAPSDQSFTKQYAGIFRFKFWHFGDWIEVVVDDRLPYYNGEAIFAHSKDGKEFWFSLLEKAYAKLHGTYEAAENAQASEVLVDLTGGIAELYEVRDYRDDDLFNILTRSNEMQSLISTKAIKYSVDPQIGKFPNEEGIYPGLMYSVTNVAKILVNKREENEEYSFMELMIRLRNPWGQGTEWNGRWHDKGREWRWVSEEDKARLGVQHLQDGEFWMSFTDYIIRFRSIEIVSLTPSSVEHSLKIPWEWTFIHGEWVTGVSAGGLLYIHKNPQYRISLTAVDELKGDGKCVACISLMQKYRRAMQKLGKSEVSIGFEIYHLKKNYLQIIPVPEQFFLEANYPLVHCPATETREVTLTVRLPPGTYLIIPFTEQFSTEAEFLIRVCASSFVKLSANERLLRLKAKREVLAYDELFESYAEKFDENEEEEIGWKNLKKIMDYFGSSIPHFKGFSKETVRSAIALTDANSNGRIDKVEYETLCGLLKHYKGLFVKFDKKNTGYLPPFAIGIIFDHLGFEINNTIQSSIVHRYAREDGSFSFDDYILCVMKFTALCMKFKGKASKRSNIAKFGLDDWLEATIFT